MLNVLGFCHGKINFCSLLLAKPGRNQLTVTQQLQRLFFVVLIIFADSYLIDHLHKASRVLVESTEELNKKMADVCGTVCFFMLLLCY